jgi:CRISPR/Cas system-associated exonuclease Cas4 (RecB family)
LTCFYSWLSASLDYGPDALGAAALSAAENIEAPPEDMIRQECVKVSIIKAEMLHRIPKNGPVVEDVVVDFRTRLSTFHSQLPDWMSLSHTSAAEHNELMTQFRPVIFYVHLFYLSAMMLLSRRLVIAYISLDAVAKVSLPPEARQAIEDGFVAAQTNASVMNIMLSEGKVVQVCWLCM